MPTGYDLQTVKGLLSRRQHGEESLGLKTWAALPLPNPEIWDKSCCLSEPQCSHPWNKDNIFLYLNVFVRFFYQDYVSLIKWIEKWGLHIYFSKRVCVKIVLLIP